MISHLKLSPFCKVPFAKEGGSFTGSEDYGAGIFGLRYPGSDKLLEWKSNQNHIPIPVQLCGRGMPQCLQANVKSRELTRLP